MVTFLVVVLVLLSVSLGIEIKSEDWLSAFIILLLILFLAYQMVTP